ncbi:MAG: alanine racemase [Bradyrhizobiaceae bacterium]|nr:MAG: alanine racemase [Bradyrhizobiaceae bacterium]
MNRPSNPQRDPSGMAEAGGLLTIDLAALVANWRALAARATGAECAAVVKADAYGCGIAPVAGALAAAGCRTFFVAHLAEGRRVREAAPEATVYLLNGLLPGTAPALAEAGLRPILGSLAEVAEWNGFAEATGWTGGAALHIDTGMNRLGLAPAEARTAAARPPRNLALVMSHLACADETDHPLTARQVAAFRELRTLFPGIAGSLANSSGIFLGGAAYHDLVRPGVALYGANPTPAGANPMRAVVRLEGRIVQLRRVAAGETVGYGATWTARRDSRIAVIAVGYADGLLRAASASDHKPGAEAVVAGRRCPLAGRISMDLAAIDVTDVPEEQVMRGDLATLLGEEIGVDALAARAGTIGYEILTGLGRRYHRVYV